MTVLALAGRCLFPPLSKPRSWQWLVSDRRIATNPWDAPSASDTRQVALERGIVSRAGTTTIRDWLYDLAIKPWQVQSWVFPRDPEFEVKASRVLDLYEGYWEGHPLGPRDVVLCADEKTCIQARRRRRVLGLTKNHGILVDYDYVREGRGVADCFERFSGHGQRPSCGEDGDRSL